MIEGFWVISFQDASSNWGLHFREDAALYHSNTGYSVLGLRFSYRYLLIYL